MSPQLAVIGVATFLLAFGVWLMLPRGASIGRSLGAVLVAISLGLYIAQVPRIGNWASECVFLILAAVTVLSAVATITFRNPVYSAIWFALTLLGTAGLFLYQGAQFLGVATVVVYAGAILVTFLFVLMLANPGGHDFYDRISWGPRLAAITGALVVGMLTLTLAGIFQNPQIDRRPRARIEPAALASDILSDEHMAHLGAQLFSKHLVSVEVAGTLLLVALVGTVAIVAQIRRPVEMEDGQHG